MVQHEVVPNLLMGLLMGRILDVLVLSHPSMYVVVLVRKQFTSSFLTAYIQSLGLYYSRSSESGFQLGFKITFEK